MRTDRRAVLAGLLQGVLAAGTALGQGLELTATPVASGLDRPLGAVHAGDGSGRLFLVQQSGQILILDGGSMLPTPFLDIGAKVGCCGEGGLLGLAFHPSYASNGLFYVAYTEAAPNSASANDLVVARYQVSADPDVADAASELVLMTIFEPFTNHNGGNLAFDDQGLLYIGSGDGGSGGDPGNRAQNLDTLLGKLLRIDVDGADPGREYAIPPTNPFAGDAPAGCTDSCPLGPCGTTCDEIWAYGLRNPWRFSFDRDSGDLYIGDVGQSAWEEIDFQPAASAGGENYGWNVLEGDHCYPPDPSESCTPPAGYVPPILEYSHDLLPGCDSVTGGFTYRGSALPRLAGVYVYGDACHGVLWGTVPRCSGAPQARELLDASLAVTSLGEDESGELYVADLGGSVYRLGLAPGSGGPALELFPDPIDFGAPPAASLEVTLANANLGPEAVVIEGLALAAGADFTLNEHGGSAPCGSTSPCLAPGASCTVELQFSGTGTAWFLDTLLTPANSEVTGVPLGACTAQDDVVLSSMPPVTTRQTFDACDTLTTGPGFSVASTGHAILRAGQAAILDDGTTVAGSLEVHAGLP